MKKDYKKWHILKSDINDNKSRVYFHEREVWFASLGANIGSEQDGGKGFLRPVVIVKKFNNEIFWAIPTTKQPRTGKYYYTFMYKEQESTSAILSQIRLIDCKRLEYPIGMISKTDFADIKNRLISFLK